MRGAATIQGGSGRTFQHGHVLDIVWVDSRNTITEVVTTLGACVAEVSIVQGHAVDNVQRLVIASHFGITTQQYAGRTGGTTGGVLYDQTGHLT